MNIQLTDQQARFLINEITSCVGHVPMIEVYVTTNALVLGGLKVEYYTPKFGVKNIDVYELVSMQFTINSLPRFIASEIIKDYEKQSKTTESLKQKIKSTAQANKSKYRR